MVRQNNTYLLFSFFVFFLAQFLYSIANAGFFSNYFGALTQLATAVPDTEIFRAHFWQSLYYFHIAPPLYILYAYGFQFLFPPEGELGIYLLHTFLGLLSVYSLYYVQAWLGINKRLNVFLITLFVLSPSYNLYQTMGWYDFPVMCLLLISAWRFIRLYEEPDFKNGFIFFGVIGLLCGIRSLYHVYLYFVPLIMLTMIFMKANRKQVFFSCLLPFLFVFALYFKNYLLFNVFTINSFSGEVLANITMQFNMTLGQKQHGIAEGYFSDLALCPQSPDTVPGKADNMGYDGVYCYTVVAEKYRQQYIHSLGRDYKNIPVLNPVPNAIFVQRNVLGNIGMDLEYQKNAVQAIKHYPLIYLKSILNSWRIYFVNSPSYFYQNMVNVRQLPDSLRMNLWNFNPEFHKLINNKGDQLSIMILMLYPFLLVFSVGYWLLSRFGLSVFSGIYALFVLPITGAYLCAVEICRFFDAHLQIWLMLMILGFSGLLMLTMLLVRVIAKHALSLSRFINPAFDAGKRVVVFYLFSNIIFTTMIVNFVAGNEQQRYRFYVDGLYLILFGLAMQTLFGRKSLR